MLPSQLLSVVISTYNRSDALLAVLKGLQMQTDKNFEVIIADDGSTQAHSSLVRQSEVAKKLRAIYLWHPDVGFTLSKVRNRGAGLANGEYLVFMDGDCVPEIDFVAQHKRLAQPGYFVNGSRVLLSAQLTAQVLTDAQKVAGQPPAFWLKQRLGGHCNKLTGLIRLPDGRGRTWRRFTLKGIRGCNLAMWRTDFQKVDGFDESFVGWGHEDADLVVRLSHAGVSRKNGFCATEVFHLWHKESSRSQESANAKLVTERSKTTIVRAVMGYSQVRVNEDVVIERIGNIG
jgi:GT2 family glycosyltransferase